MAHARHAGRGLLALALVLGLAGPLRAQAPDYETEVMPLLTRAGCNSGACHGAAIGRGGLRLSLLGHDPAADYESLVFESKGRRVHLAKPGKSLLLRKPTGQVEHEGGVRFGTGSESYDLLERWIAAGAPIAPRRQLKSLVIEPKQRWLASLDDKFTFAVTATFSDGTSTDVTRWALLAPADPAALIVSARGEVKPLLRGQHAIMIRYLGAVDAVTVTVPLFARAPAVQEWPSAGFIDDQINKTLQKLHISPAPRASDAALVRRLYLDLIGTLPEPDEVSAYLGDNRADKYARLVERLFQRPEFVDYWSYQWGDLLRIESGRLQPQGVAAFHQWVRKQVAGNTPLDRMAREMLLAVGDGHASGPVNFSRVPADAQAQAEYVSQTLLGVRLQCANCHNHPLDRWTQDDYHGLAAVFAKLGRGQTISVKAGGEVIHPRTSQAAKARLPGGPWLDGKADPRTALADWITARDNPFFARAAVNRLWKALMGRGLVEPVDDHRATNPATHPELLSQLASDFSANGFDMRRTIKQIVLSEAYRRSAVVTPGQYADDRFYSRYLTRPLPPVVLLDAVARVTGVPDVVGERAIALGDARVASEALDLLGRCNRTDCATGGNRAGSLPLVLHKINGGWLNDKIAHPRGRLRQLLAAGKDHAAIVAELYRLALGREPSAVEAEHWAKRIGALPASERGAALEDFAWALLNATEFTTNH